MTIFHVVVGLVMVQRLGELWLAAANTRRLRALGAYEIDRAGYKWFVVLHAFWLASLLLLVPPATQPIWPLLVIVSLLQVLRLWVIASLGRRWTTRIIVLPGAPLVRAGPYRWCRHPNYAIVVGEFALLPLAFGAIGIAAIFSLANSCVLARRIRIEQRAFAAAA